MLKIAARSSRLQLFRRVLAPLPATTVRFSSRKSAASRLREAELARTEEEIRQLYASLVPSESELLSKLEQGTATSAAALSSLSSASASGSGSGSSPSDRPLPPWLSHNASAKVDPVQLLKNVQIIDSTQARKDKQQLASRADAETADTTAVVRDDQPNEPLSMSRFHSALYLNSLAKRPDQAEKVIALMNEIGMKPDERCYDHLVEAYSNSANLPGTIATFKRITTDGLTPSVCAYGSLIKAYCTAGRLDDAFEIYKGMMIRGTYANIMAYTILLKGCVESNDIERAWTTYEEMRYVGCQPDEVVFSVMLHACSRSGEAERALDLFTEMTTDLHLVPTDVSINSLLQALSFRPDYFGEAVGIAERIKNTFMESNPGYKGDNALGLGLKIHGCNSLIYAAAKARNLGVAREIARGLISRSLEQNSDLDPETEMPNEATFTNLFYAYASHLPLYKKQHDLEYPTRDGFELKSDAPEWKQLIERYIAFAVSPKHGSKARNAQPTTEETSVVEHALEINPLTGPVPRTRNEILAEASAVFTMMVDTFAKQLNPEHFTIKQDRTLNELYPQSHHHHQQQNETRISTRLLNSFVSVLSAMIHPSETLKFVHHAYPELSSTEQDAFTYQQILSACGRLYYSSAETGRAVWREFDTWAKNIESRIALTEHYVLPDHESRADRKSLLKTQSHRATQQRLAIGLSRNAELERYVILANFLGQIGDLQSGLQVVRWLTKAPPTQSQSAVTMASKDSQRPLQLYNHSRSLRAHLFKNLSKAMIDAGREDMRDEVLYYCARAIKTGLADGRSLSGKLLGDPLRDERFDPLRKAMLEDGERYPAHVVAENNRSIRYRKVNTPKPPRY